MKRYAIIVAGGSGSRVNAGIPKQFLLLGGKPVLMHTVMRFRESDHTTEIIVVLPKAEIAAWKKLREEHSFSVPHEIAEGGETRFHSVKNGLQLVKEKSIVAVHDGVRPFVSTSFINRVFSEAEKYGNAVPAIPFSESIRTVADGKNSVVDRSSFVIVQTPQCFDSETLKTAYNTDYRDSFTDDASVVEFQGKSIHLTEGSRENIKITYPVDLLTGEMILKKYFP